MFFTARKPVVRPETLDGVIVRDSQRAKRMALRLDNELGDIVLIWPKRTSEKSARRFVEENRQWIARQRALIVPVPSFAPEMSLTVYGRSVRVVHQAGRGLAKIENDVLVIRGDAAHFSRRLKDFLKKEALVILKKLSDEKAAMLDLKPSAVRVIDPKTRWGSCAPDGKLMYSWRLILAPPFVLDYVVAHEVAHRVHMNHGRRFWALCARLTDDAAGARRWLRTSEGQQLMMWK